MHYAKDNVFRRAVILSAATTSACEERGSAAEAASVIAEALTYVLPFPWPLKQIIRDVQRKNGNLKQIAGEVQHMFRGV